LSAILTGEAGEMPRNSTVLQITLRNSSSVPLLLRNLGPRRFSNASDIVTVPAQGEIIVNLFIELVSQACCRCIESSAESVRNWLWGEDSR
jgi:hypothetical protein